MISVRQFQCLKQPIAGVEDMTAISPVQIVFTLLFTALIVINLLGNSVVCVVVLRYRGMRAPINYLLVNLALADMLVALGIACQYLITWTYHHSYGTSGDYICKFLTGGNFIRIGGLTSGFFLMAIAVERYLATTQLIRDRFRLTTRRLTAVIIVGWTFAMVYNMPLFLVVELIKDGGNQCTEHWCPNENLGKAFSVGCFFFFGAIPVVTMVTLYSKVLYKLWKGGIHATLLCKQARMRSKLKVTKMVIVVSVLYAICWLPNLVIYMLSRFNPDLLEHGSYFFADTFVISVVLVALNSAMNPFIYALHSTNFRRHIKSALCCRTYRAADLTNAYNANFRCKFKPDNGTQKRSLRVNLILHKYTLTSSKQETIGECVT